MKNILILTKKELRHYFNSPIAYVIMFAFLLINGWFFGSNLFLQDQASLRSYFSIVPLLLIFFIPAFSMRLLSEEKKQGTLELLATSPLKDEEIVLGKYLGAVVFYAIMLLSTVTYPLTVAYLGNLDWGPVIGGYLGIMFTGMAIISIGLFFSSLTSNQIVAFIFSFSTGFALFMVGKVLSLVPGSLTDMLYFIGFDSHFANISKGIVDSRDILYYFSLISLMLFMTLQSLVNRKK